MCKSTYHETNAHWKDLDLGTVSLAIATVTVSLWFVGLVWRDRRNEWPTSIGFNIPVLLLLFAGCMILGYRAHCPDADQPHIHKTGQLIQKYQAIFHQRRSVSYGVLACMDSCEGDVPLIVLDASAAAAWQQAGVDRPYSVVYLGRKKATDTGPFTVTAHPPVEISDVATGRSLLFIDTARHWPRVLLLAFAAILCILSAAICKRFADEHPDPDDAPDDGDDPAEAPEELTRLGLGSEDQAHS